MTRKFLFGLLLPEKPDMSPDTGQLIGYYFYKSDDATQSNPLPAPTNLVAMALSASSIALQWQDNSADETAFYVYRGTTQFGPYSFIASVGGGITSYTDTALVPQTTYYYRVTALRSVEETDSESAETNEANATTLTALPGLPTSVQAVALNSTDIDITWQDNSDNEDGFRLYRGLTSDALSLVQTLGAGVTVRHATGLAPETTYWWALESFNAAGSSGLTVPVYATTLQAEGPLLYRNEFDNNPANTIDAAYGNIGIYGDQSDIRFFPPSIGPAGSGGHFDGPDAFIVTDPDNAANKVLKIFMDASSSGVNWEAGSELRHRILLGIGDHIDNDFGIPHATGYTGFRVVPDVEYWFGFRVRVAKVGNALDGSPDIGSGTGRWSFLFAPVSLYPGDPVIRVRGDGTWDIIAERYTTPDGATIETKVNIGAVAWDEWHDIVIRWIKRPYSWGTPTAYIPGTVGGPKAGVFEVWMDGEYLTAASRGDSNPCWSGADREGREEPNSLVRLGVYWSDASWNPPASLTVYLDTVSIAVGPNRYADVDPSGPQAVVPYDALYVQGFDAVPAQAWSRSAFNAEYLDEALANTSMSMAANGACYLSGVSGATYTNFTVVEAPSPVRTAGGRSMKIFNRVGDLCEWNGSTDPVKTSKSRQEVEFAALHYDFNTASFNGDGRGWDHGDETWIGISYYFPLAANSAWWNSTTSDRFIIFQIFGVERPAPTLYTPNSSPVLHFLIGKYGQVSVDSAYGVGYPPDVGSDDEIVHKYGVVMSFLPDAWNDVVVQWKKHYIPGLAETRIWLNGQLVLEALGAELGHGNCPQKFTGSFFKAGVYRGASISRDVTVYIDECRLARGSDPRLKDVVSPGSGIS